MYLQPKTIEQENAEWAAYEREVAACDCLTPERKAFVREKMIYAEGFPDHGHDNFMEHHRIEAWELGCFSSTHYATNHARYEVKK